MERAFHTFSELFRQLGLDGDPARIDAFLGMHALAPGMALPDAPFWSAEQAEFLREAWQADSDWTPVVEALNEALRCD